MNAWAIGEVRRSFKTFHHCYLVVYVRAIRVMDLGEILSYKPDTSTKRSRENEDEEELPPR